MLRVDVLGRRAVVVGRWFQVIGDHPRWFWPAAMAVLLIGLVARVPLMAPMLRQPPDDPDNYLVLAESLAQGNGYRINDRPTAYRPPLYPLALAPGVALFGQPPIAWIIGLHAVLGAATIGLTGLAAWRWFGRPWTTVLALVLVALDPVLVAQSRSVMTETMAAALVAGLLATIGRQPTVGSAALTGFVGGLAGLCRPSLLPGVGLVALGLGGLGPGPIRHRLLQTSTLIAVMVLTLSPWAIRNAITLGEPVWTTTHGGYTLLLANNPAFYDDVIRGPMDVWSGPNQKHWVRRVGPNLAGLSEPEANRAFYRRAIAVMTDRPVDCLRATIGRFGRFWALAPSGAVYSAKVCWLTAGWTLPFWVLVVWGLGQGSSWRWPILSAVALVLALSAIHLVFWTDLRMRAPVIPALALIGAWGGSKWPSMGGVTRTGISRRIWMRLAVPLHRSSSPPL